MSKKNSKKKEKIKYIDDGRTIADMSGTSRSNPLLGNSSLSSPRGKSRASAKEAWQTYWAAVKTMFFPMLVVMMIITAAFLIVALMLR
jgi:hypothetical protein